MSVLKRILHPSLYPKGWRKFERSTLKTYSLCAFCFAKRRLEVHHIIPLHLGGPALDSKNVIVLCRSCHLQEGHLGNFRLYFDPDIDDTAYANRVRLLNVREAQIRK